ncbi:MAG: hypothetical protein Q7S58_10640 [Candidatus Binatus sp.]|uniref:hypothetical protein n=1 Tax=Candidatus Binatus sp. TaxID=2811406 RepID=UPI00271E9705|nr:hypothetical protein [Candidatus Binatus sp.]MDO8432851.1 hypothetical protein [Candidatus Binatus sp.]
MKNPNFRSLAAMLAGAIVAAAPQIANACAMCGLSPNDPAGHAYNSSVLFMLASPYVSFAAVGGITYLVYRRARRSEERSRPEAGQR